MTSFPTQLAGTPVFTPLFSEDKGTLGNRLDCSAAQTKNAVVTAAKIAVPASIVGGAVYAMKKHGDKPFIAKTVKNSAELINSGLTTLKNTWKNPTAQKYLDKFITANPKLKIAAALALLASPFIAYFGAKGIYQTGQIDQRYTDKAHTQDILRA